MAYTALYRKWRPQTFDDVRGQDHIVTALRNQVNSGHIGHAYLFCGTRGTGKTSVAKIFARAVNCEHPADGNPCNKCDNCQAILAESSMNVIEIDAASNNGVDDIRKIREEVRYSPTEGKYRVYIIDEVHMLSASAFNALLKTLEEPPAYVIFILATTEPERIPVTVLSRCQRYDFRRIGTDVIKEQLLVMTKAEGIAIEEKALSLIARKGDGSMRDAESLLEQCAAFYSGQTLSYEDVLDILGSVDTEVFGHLLHAIGACDVSSCIRILDDVTKAGRDLTQFVTDFIWYIRNLLLMQTGADAEEELDMSADNMRALKEESASFETDTLLRYIRILSELSGQMRLASAKRVLLETTFIRMMRPEMETENDAILERLDRLEENMTEILSGTVTCSGEEKKNPEEKNRQEPEETDGQEDRGIRQEAEDGKQISVTPAVFADFQTIKENWNRLIGMQSKLVAGFLKNCELGYSSEHGYEILCPDAFSAKMLQNPGYAGEISKAAESLLGKAVTFVIRRKETDEQAPKLMQDDRIPGIEMDIGTEEE